MVKMFIHEGAPHSAVSYYRSIGTLSYLHKINPKIDIRIPEKTSWVDMAGADIFYMERPFRQGDLVAFQMAKDFGLKVWVDYDDNLFDLPEDNPAYKTYMNEATQKNVIHTLQNADIITVSTEYLKKTFEKYRKDIIVIQNAFNNYNYKLEKREQSNVKDVLISWRGSRTHRKDVESVKEDLISIAQQFKNDVTFLFIGEETSYTFEEIKKHSPMKKIDEVDIIDYNHIISKVNSSIQIVPLVDNEFNKCKSNIGLIEGTYAGACTIAPNAIPEFLGNCINYTDNFKYLLEKAIKSKSFRQKEYEKSYQYVNDNLMLSKINKKRIEIIEGLL